jgi:hypothetical protein
LEPPWELENAQESELLELPKQAPPALEGFPVLNPQEFDGDEERKSTGRKASKADFFLLSSLPQQDSNAHDIKRLLKITFEKNSCQGRNRAFALETTNSY